MRQTIRAYFPVGGAVGRSAALRLFLRYGIRPTLISRTVRLTDRLFPFWRVCALPSGLPDDLYAQALCHAAKEEADDRLAVLYLWDLARVDGQKERLEQVFVLRDAQAAGVQQRPEQEVAYDR